MTLILLNFSLFCSFKVGDEVKCKNASDFAISPNSLDVLYIVIGDTRMCLRTSRTCGDDLETVWELL